MRFFSRRTDPSKKLAEQTRKNTAANASPVASTKSSFDSSLSQAETVSSKSPRSTAIRWSTNSTSSTSSSTRTHNPHKKENVTKTKSVDDSIADAYRQANMHHSPPVFWSWS